MARTKAYSLGVIRTRIDLGMATAGAMMAGNNDEEEAGDVKGRDREQ